MSLLGTADSGSAGVSRLNAPSGGGGGGGGVKSQPGGAYNHVFNFAPPPKKNPKVVVFKVFEPKLVDSLLLP